MTVNAALLQARFEASQGTDPIFRRNDGANSPNDVHLAYAKELDPNVTRAQLSCFENNESIIKAHERNGYVRMKRYVCDNEDILKYLPFNVKVLLEKSF